MRIAIITSPFGTLPPYGIGAVEKLWYNVATVFAEAGHDVIFYCKQPDREYIAESGILFQNLRGYKRTGHLISDLMLDLFYSFRALMRLTQCDILVMHTFFTPLLCPLFRRKFNAAVYNVARYPKGQLGWYTGIDRLFCVSQAVAKAAIQQAPRMAGKIKVINNPVDTEIFNCRVRSSVSNTSSNNRSPSMGDDFGVHRNCYLIGYSGRIHPEKGLDLLVKAYALLRGKGHCLRLRIIGPRTVAQGGGGEKYVAYLKRLASCYPIEWVDPVTDAVRLAEELAACDIFCYPSMAERGETFGVAPLEAMAVGCATVVSALECFQDFIKDGVTGLVFNHRSIHPDGALADRIEYLIEHADVREKITMEATRLAHDSFSNGRIAREYLNDFELLLQKEKK